MTDKEVENLHQDWLKGHHILFQKNGVHYFAYCDHGLQILCDDGEELRHRVIETKNDLFYEHYAGGTFWGLLKGSEIEYIY